MKQFLSFFVCFLVLNGVYAQGWEPVGSVSSAAKGNNGIKSLWYDNGVLYAGGAFNSPAGNRFVKWNGAEWEHCGGSAEPRIVCVDKEHNFYSPGMVDTNRQFVMKWHDTTWSELGTGSNALNMIKEISAMCADKDGNIYVAGSFNDTTDGKHNIAMWNGTSWRQLGTGINALHANDRIWTLAADSRGNIYAGGWFYESGHVYVAKWDGTSWSRMGVGDNPIYINANENGLRPYITKIHVDAADNVYMAATVWHGYAFVSKWDGTSWKEMGDRYKGKTPTFIFPIETITSDQLGNIYIGGLGVRDLVTERNCVMTWNGSSWGPVGAGVAGLNGNGAVAAICTDENGVLYAAGEFTDEEYKWGGSNYVAKYNTQSTTVEIPEVQPIRAWPNPANSLLYVAGSKFNEHIYVCDMMGAVRMKLLNKIAASGATPVIDISGLAPGTYFLRSQNCTPFVFVKN